MSKQQNWKLINSPSKARLDANRANAQSSTGPRTAEGKVASSRNAITHGLTARSVVLRVEDAEEYEHLRAGLRRSLAPVGEEEERALEEYVLSIWRLQRCRLTETAVLDDCMKTLMEEDPSLAPEQALARVFTDPVYQKKISLFLRYQTAIERAVNRAHNALLALQQVRREAQAEAEQQACNARVHDHSPEPVHAHAGRAAAPLPLPSGSPDIFFPCNPHI